MKKYLLLLFLIFYVTTCQFPVHQKTKQDSNAKKTPFIVKQEVKNIPKRVALKEIKKNTKVKHVKPKKSVTTPLPLIPKIIKEKAMSEKEFYEKMFGKRAVEKVVKNLIVPLIINRKFGRNTRLNIVSGKHYIQSIDLKTVLIRFLPQKLLAKIFHKDNVRDGGIDIQTLHKYGIDSYFNEEDIAVYISISPEVRIPTKLKFSHNKQEMDETFDSILKAETATISGASNFHLRDSFSNANVDGTVERAEAVLRNQTFVNYHDYILNTGFVLTEPSISGTAQTNLFSTDYTYVSKDFPRENKRVKVGDVSLLGLNKMGTRFVLGASLVNHFDITRRIGSSIRITEKEIYLFNESQMEVFINKRLVSTLTLQPGVHLLSDFPLIAGRNHVSIKIVDIFGATKEINFDDYYYFELLREGMSTYGISAGIAADKDVQNNVVYTPQEQFFSANYNLGLAKDMTINNGLQAAPGLMAYESEFYYGSSYGLFSGFGIVSKTDNYDYGYKYGYGYRNVFGKTSFSFNQEFVDANYKNITSDFGTDLSSKSLSTQLGTSLSLGAQLTASYSDRTSLGNEIKSYGLSYNQRINSNWNVKFDIKSSQLNEAAPSKSGMFTLRYTPRSTRVSYTSSVEQENASGVHEINTRAALDFRKQGQFGLDGSFEYEDYENSYIKERMRAKYSDTHYVLNTDYQESTTPGTTVSKSGAVNLSTAVAFVNDNYSITQPVSSSFILVKNDDFFEDKPLGIRYYNADTPSKDFVMPTADYGIKELTAEDKDLIFGVDLKETNFKVASRYKTGTLVTLAPKFILSIKGRLHDSENQAIALKVFKVYDVADDGTKKVLEENPMFFTNSAGKFVIMNINAGNYFVEEINSEEPYSFTFSAKAKKTGGGIINLGIIKPEKTLLEKNIVKEESESIKETNHLTKLENEYVEPEEVSRLSSHASETLARCDSAMNEEQKECEPIKSLPELLTEKEMIKPFIVGSSDSNSFVNIGISPP